MPADRGEQPNQVLLLAHAEALHRGFVRPVHGVVQACDQGQTLGRDGAFHQSTIGTRALPPDQLFGLEAIEQSRDAGGPFDQPLPDLEGGEGLGMNPAEHPQDVVLLERNARLLDGLRKVPSDEISGPEHGNGRFLRGRREGAFLVQLLLQAGVV